MSNLQSGAPMTEFDRRSRERIKFGVFAVLTASALLLGTTLIYKARKAPTLTPAEALTSTLTNAPSVTNDP
jgi:hypothetical protein